MTRFLDGPAAGVCLELQRAAMFLRVVQGNDNKWDALDQLEDTPSQTETIHAYIIKGEPGFAFVDGRDRKTGKRIGRRMVIAEYVLFQPQPSDEIMRDNDKWGDWATETGTAMLKGPN